VKEVYFWLKISRIFLCSMHMAAWVGALVRAGHTGACPDVAPRAGLLHRSEEWVQLGDLKILGILRYYCYMNSTRVCSAIVDVKSVYFGRDCARRRI
jgi:hypothetical protein